MHEVLPGEATPGVRIVAITTFPDSLLKSKFTPLSRVAAIEPITLVCDRPGPPIPNVQYVVPPRWLYGATLHKAIAKLITLFLEVRRRRPTLVMAYTLFPHGISAWLVGRLFRKPVMVHLTGGFIELTVKSELSDNSLVKAMPIFAGAVEALSRSVIKRCDYVMVPGSVTRSFLVETVGVSDDRIVNLHSTVDAERFVVSESPKDFDLVLVASLRGLKRCDLFIETVQLLRAQRPTIRAVIVGDGYSGAALRKLVDEKDLDDHVFFAGFRDDPSEFYHRSQVFLLPSAAEGLSTAVLEGMACGVPAVASDVGDMRDIVIDEVTGYAVRDSDRPEDYADAVLRILENPERCAVMSWNCRDLVAREHSFPQATRKWEALLDRV